MFSILNTQNLMSVQDIVSYVSVIHCSRILYTKKMELNKYIVCRYSFVF